MCSPKKGELAVCFLGGLLQVSECVTVTDAQLTALLSAFLTDDVTKPVLTESAGREAKESRCNDFSHSGERAPTQAWRKIFF